MLAETNAGVSIKIDTLDDASVNHRDLFTGCFEFKALI